MTRDLIGPRYLMRWNHSSPQVLGRDPLKTTHRLAELTLFTDEGLSTILDRYPRHAVRVTTTGEDLIYPNQLRFGQVGSHSGSELLEMIRRGRFQLRLQNLVRHDVALASIVRRLFEEMMECQPGVRIERQEGDLEISSPLSLTYYRIDPDPSIFWQVRGSQRVISYPGCEPFVCQRQIEQTLGGFEKPLYFEPAFADRAEIQMQSPGDALALPQHSPYHVVTGRSLCVSLITSYETAQSRHRNEIHRANQRLGRFVDAHSIATSGIPAALKRGCLRLLGNQTASALSNREPTFRLDPNVPNCISPLNDEGMGSPSIAIVAPGSPTDGSISVPTVSEV